MSLDQFFSESKIKGIAIISTILVSLSIIVILFAGPATGYESSIYAQYPWYFWFLILLAFFICQFILISYALYNLKGESWKYSVLTIALIDLILCGLPQIRGYFVYGSEDVLTHVGYMRDIITNGYISTTNLYPVEHLLGVSVSYITGLSIENITTIIPLFFSLFFLISIVVLTNLLYNDKAKMFVLIAFSSIPLFGMFNVMFTPNGQAFLLLPIFLYLVYKVIQQPENRKFYTLLVILALSIVFFHPLVSIFMIIILIFQNLTSAFEPLEKARRGRTKFYSLTAVIIILFSIWSSYILIATKTFKIFIDAVTGTNEVLPEIQKYSTTLSTFNINFKYIIDYALNVYGQNIILGILSILCVGVLVWLLFIRKQKVSGYLVFSGFNVCFYLIASSLSLLLIDVFGWGRLYIVSSLFTLILIPPTLFIIKESVNWSRHCHSINSAILILVCVILISTLYFSTINLHFSPITRIQNQQVSLNDYTGMGTFFDVRDERFEIRSMGVSPARYYDAQYGKDSLRNNILYSYQGHLMPEDHFGYAKTTVSDPAPSYPSYLMLNTQAKEYYPAVYPEFPEYWRFTDRDFFRLENDGKMNYIYNSGSLEIYKREF